MRPKWTQYWTLGTQRTKAIIFSVIWELKENITLEWANREFQERNEIFYKTFVKLYFNRVKILEGKITVSEVENSCTECNSRMERKENQWAWRNYLETTYSDEQSEKNEEKWTGRWPRYSDVLDPQIGPNKPPKTAFSKNTPRTTIQDRNQQRAGTDFFQKMELRGSKTVRRKLHGMLDRWGEESHANEGRVWSWKKTIAAARES